VKNFSKANLYFVFAGAVILLGGGIASMQFSSLGEKGGELTKLKQQAQDPKDLEIKLADLNNEAAATGVKLAHLEQGVPEVAYVPTMLKELEAFGKKNGIAVFGVRPMMPPASAPDKKKKAKPYEELIIEVKGKGRYASVLQFVRALNTFPKIVAVKAVSLSPKREQAEQMGYSRLDITIELRAYLFKPAKGESLNFPQRIELKPADSPNGKTPTNGEKAGTPSTNSNPSAAGQVEARKGDSIYEG
jgi:Tfp pilus assembly protein PilO